MRFVYNVVVRSLLKLGAYATSTTLAVKTSIKMILSPLHDYDVKPPIHVTFYGGPEYSFLFLNMDKVLKNATQRKWPTFGK